MSRLLASQITAWSPCAVVMAFKLGMTVDLYKAYDILGLLIMSVLVSIILAWP